MPINDHILRDVVNSLRDVAIEFHAAGQLRERLRQALGPLISQENGLQAEKIAPVQGYPRGIPWSIHMDAYDVYCKRYGKQEALIDLEGRGCRGGFSTGELDSWIPGWRDKVSEMARLRARIAELEDIALAPAPLASITLDGHQLRMALEFINPDGPENNEQLDDSLTFGIRQHGDDDGKISTGMCCWNDDTDGVLPLDGEYEAAPASSPPVAHAKLSVGVHAGAEHVTVAVHMHQAGHTTVLYTQNHPAKRETAGIVDFPLSVLSAPQPSPGQQVPFMPVPHGWKLVLQEPTPEIIASAAIAAWPTATPADFELARQAAKIVLMKMDMAPGTTAESVAAMLATMAPAYRAMLAAGPAAPAPRADKPSPGALHNEKEAERLRWMAESGARVSWSIDREYCTVFLPAERDGSESRPAEGYPLQCYDSWHRAIDEAIAVSKAT